MTMVVVVVMMMLISECRQLHRTLLYQIILDKHYNSFPAKKENGWKWSESAPSGD